MQAGGGYIIGEKFRCGSPEVMQALSRPGRYATVRDNLQVKEVNIDSEPAHLSGQLSTKPGLKRYLRTNPADDCGSTRRRSPPRRTWTASTSCAPPARSCQPRA
ncbi:hypothetical protein ACH4UM_39660 [Streptomyces sp. NPDC020801]|uniref:hypothetical protein n=1 Tax=unclassified Streptomyces TaxID=2593676 RepID=UPI0037996C27